jgi:hypothetical protein
MTLYSPGAGGSSRPLAGWTDDEIPAEIQAGCRRWAGKDAKDMTVDDVRSMMARWRHWLDQEGAALREGAPEIPRPVIGS